MLHQLMSCYIAMLCYIADICLYALVRHCSVQSLHRETRCFSPVLLLCLLLSAVPASLSRLSVLLSLMCLLEM